MEYLALHTGAPKVNWEDDTSCIYVAEAKDLILDFNTFLIIRLVHRKFMLFHELIVFCIAGWIESESSHPFSTPTDNWTCI